MRIRTLLIRTGSAGGSAGLLVTLATLWTLVAAPTANGAVISVPSDRPTIQAAVDFASDGDVIEVGPGIYFENVELGCKSLEIVAPFGPSLTWIDAGTGFRSFDIDCPTSMTSTVRISGFTITGGTGAWSGAYADPIGGAGIRIQNSNVTIEQCRFLSIDSTERGAAINLRSLTQTSLVIEACEFDDVSSDREASAVYAWGPVDVQIRDCVVEDNIVTSTGSSMVLEVWDIVMENVTVRALLGGSQGVLRLYPYGPPPVAVYSTLITGLIIEDCQQASVGSIVSTRSLLEVRDSIIRNNTAQVGTAGGFGGGESVMRFEDCLFEGNIATLGESLLGTSSSVSSNVHEFVRCTIVGNTSTAYMIGGDGTDSIRFDSCIIRDNTSASLAFSTASSIVDIDYCNSQFPVATGTGNIDADPLFVDPAAGDYRLRFGSPSIDAGNPLLPLDPDGSPADQGAFGALGPNYLRGDANGDFLVDLADAIEIFDRLFDHPTGPDCAAAADTNDDGLVDIADGIWLLTILFLDPQPLAAPSPDCDLSEEYPLPCAIPACP